MSDQRILQFPVRNPHLFSPEINCEILNNSEFSRVLYAAIRALPHVQDSYWREELKRALSDVLSTENDAA